jgi:DNA-binding cell septation regulator SpoVG
MKITEIKIVPADEGRIKADVTITFDNCLVVSQLKLIKSKKGLPRGDASEEES